MIRQNLEVSSYLETVAKSCMNVYMNADKFYPFRESPNEIYESTKIRFLQRFLLGLGDFVLLFVVQLYLDYLILPILNVSPHVVSLVCHNFAAYLT